VHAPVLKFFETISAALGYDCLNTLSP